MRWISSFLLLLSFSLSFGFPAKVIRISDGDTIVVENLKTHERVKVRIWGIDTPEKFFSSKLYREAKKCGVEPETIHYLGKLASKHAHEYLYPGEIVEIIPKGYGHYGRLLGKVIVDGEDYGLLMIEDGYSCVYWKFAPKSYIEAMKEAEQEKKGLWELKPNVMHCLCY
ncbi:MAG TPA: thermonuclease family protein [Aquificales bacterium]|nr:thermonuclease family protein [Aquificales bacterium]